MKLRIIKKISIIVSIAFIAATFSVPNYVEADQNIPAWPNKTVNTVAKSSCLIDYDTGTVLYESNAHKKRYPASITKVLTTLLTIENCKMDEQVTFSKNSLACIRDGAANIGAVAGETMSVKDCLYGLMLQSGNECATALGEHMFGDEKTFAAKLNERAKKAGALDSHFVNGNGLHNDNHYVTAYDMAMIMRDALRYPVFREIIGTTQYTIPKNNKRKKRFMSTMRHKMIWEGGPYYYKGIIGGKTGFTDQARNTLVTAAKRGNLTLIAVVLKSDTNNVYTDTAALFNYGFKNFKSLNVSQNDSRFKEDDNAYLESPFIKNVGTIKIDPTATVVIPKAANYSMLNINSTFNVTRNVVSTLTYNYGNKEVGKANIIYQKSQKTTPVKLSTEKTTIAKETTVAATTTAKESSKSVSSMFKISPGTIIIIVCVAVLVLIIILLIRKKKKLDKIRYEKRNRYRH